MTLLAAYFTFILDYRNDTQKANSSDFFFYLSSKWVVKQRRQHTTSTMHLVQDLLMNVQGSGGSRSFAKETRALKMRSVMASHQKLTTTIWEQSSNLILLQLHEKLLKNSTLTVLWSLGIWSKLKRWKSSINGCLMSWPQIKKKLSFWSVINSHSVQ